jgi:hypothetical protein
MAKMKKYQGGGNVDPRVAAFLKKRAASDSTKMYNRGEMLETINAITAGKIKPRVDKAPAVGQGTKKYGVVNKGDTTYMGKAEFEKKYGQKKAGGKIKKAKSGGSFPDLNKDGKITKADILKGRGVIANHGTKMKKAGLGIKVKPKNLNERQIGRVDRIESGDPLRARTVANRISNRRNARGAETSVKPMAKSMMSKGGKMKMGGKCKNGC